MGFVIACQACGGMEEVSGDDPRDRERYERGVCSACLRRADTLVPGVVAWFADPATFAAFATEGAGRLRDVAESDGGESLWGPGKVGWGIVLHERGADGALGATLWGVVTAVGAPDSGRCAVAIRLVPPGGFRVAGGEGPAEGAEAHARAPERRDRICDRCGMGVPTGDFVERIRREGQGERVTCLCAWCARVEWPQEVDGPLREALAAYAHDAWSGWMKYMFEKGTATDEGTLVLPAWAVARWNRQMYTPYADLPEAEKATDRAEADRILAILRGEG